MVDKAISIFFFSREASHPSSHRQSCPAHNASTKAHPALGESLPKFPVPPAFAFLRIWWPWPALARVLPPHYPLFIHPAFTFPDQSRWHRLVLGGSVQGTLTPKRYLTDPEACPSSTLPTSNCVQICSDLFIAGFRPLPNGAEEQTPSASASPHLASTFPFSPSSQVPHRIKLKSHNHHAHTC